MTANEYIAHLNLLQSCLPAGWEFRTSGEDAYHLEWKLFDDKGRYWPGHTPEAALRVAMLDLCSPKSSTITRNYEGHERTPNDITYVWSDESVGNIIVESGGRVISSDSATDEQVVTALARKVIELASEIELTIKVAK